MSKSSRQLSYLNKTLQDAKKSDLYGAKLRNYTKKLNAISELMNLPFTSKQELRDYYPFGTLAVPIEKVIEMHTSSGTTGRATLSYFTQEDLEIGSIAISEAWKCFGINNKSRVQFMMSYGLFSGAALNTYAIQKIGGFVVPAGIQSAEKQVQMMLDLKVDTIVGTPGYYYYLLDYISDMHIPLKKLSLKQGIAAGEIYSDQVREDIERKFKIKLFDHYGLCEINTDIAYECEYRNGLHVLDEYVFPEIINPETGEVLPVGNEGELVLTTLRKKASPVIRYRTGDITSISTGHCPCGRDSVRVGRIKRRIDDLIFIKGIKIDPYELKEYIFQIAGNRIYRSIKLRVSRNYKNSKPEILLCLKDATKKDVLKAIQKSLKDRTLLTFSIKNVALDYFQRGENNKIKFVEYVDKK